MQCLNKPQLAEFISWLSRQGKNNESMAAYLSMMAVRLLELHRILKPNGSLYLHCDSTASHYLKIVLDLIFGVNNFRNEIIWCYTRPGTKHQKQFPRTHENIFWFSKGESWLFNVEPIRIPYSKSTIERGNYSVASSKVTKGIDERVLPSGGKCPEDWWQIPLIQGNAQERLGYETQKPFTLLKRIILASSNEGDTVLDPFCGCGTAIDVAQKYNRVWLGIDVTWLAIDLVEKRLKATYGDEVINTYKVHGKPFDVASAEALATKNKKEFEIWAITLVNVSPREHDGGVDGIFGFIEKDKKTRTIVVQIKGGDILNPGMVRDLIGTVKKENAAIGLMITLRDPTSGMLELANHSELYHSELWAKDYHSVQIRTVAELLSGKVFDLPTTQNPFKKAKFTKDNAEQSEAFTDE